jgi:hypothetical protein
MRTYPIHIREAGAFRCEQDHFSPEKTFDKAGLGARVDVRYEAAKLWKARVYLAAASPCVTAIAKHRNAERSERSREQASPHPRVASRLPQRRV